MARRIGSGSRGQASRTQAKSGSVGAWCASGAESGADTSPEVLSGIGLWLESFRLLISGFKVRVLEGALDEKQSPASVCGAFFLADWRDFRLVCSQFVANPSK